MMELPIVDSAMTPKEILAQNPSAMTPFKILSAIVILEVEYIGYDDKMHRGQIAVHQEVSEDVRSFFTLAQKYKFPIEKVVPISNQKYFWDDEKSCNDNNSSGYNYRVIAGTNKLSYHATGLAFDINPAQNIYIKYDEKQEEVFRAPENGVYNELAKGTLTKNHPLVIFMKQHGWIWGGDWTPEEGRVDYQHFEKHLDQVLN